MQTVNWKKYIIVFVITAFIFIIAGWLSATLTNRKVASLQSIQNRIATDILSSETQFSLLSELSCSEIGEGNLSQELNSLAEKIAYSEENINAADEVLELRKYYTLLEIKDYLLAKRISERCGTEIPTILYFYTTAENCTECVKQGYALTELRRTYPNLRVYSFDYNLEVSALNALLRIHKIEATKLPALVINGKKYVGFNSVSEIETLDPSISASLSTADDESSDAETQSNQTND